MIYNLSVRLAERLKAHGYLQDAEKEIVAYGLFSLISKLMYAVICLAVGFCLKLPLESMLFYAAFLLVKKYGGGFHASTEGRCMIISTLSILLAVGFIYAALSSAVATKVAIAAAVPAALVICLLSPVAAKEKELSEEEGKRYKKYSLLITSAVLAAAITAFALGFHRISTPLCAALVLECVLASLGKLSLRQRG